MDSIDNHDEQTHNEVAEPQQTGVENSDDAIDALLAQTQETLNQTSSEETGDSCPIDEKITDVATELATDLVAEAEEVSTDDRTDSEDTPTCVTSTEAETTSPPTNNIEEAIADTATILAETSDDLAEITQAFEEAETELTAVNDAVEEASTVSESSDVQEEDQPIPTLQDDPGVSPEEDAVNLCAASLTEKLRTELGQIKTDILSELEQLVGLLQQVDQANQQAADRLGKASDFEEAAARSEAAKHEFDAAVAQAADAKEAFEQAEMRVEQMRETWHSAQQTAVEAACRCRESIITETAS